MPFLKLALPWLMLLPLLLSGCASSPVPSVYVAQTQVRVPAPPPALVEVSQSLPDFEKWMDEIFLSSMRRVGLSSAGSQPPPTLPAKP